MSETPRSPYGSQNPYGQGEGADEQTQPVQSSPGSSIPPPSSPYSYPSPPSTPSSTPQEPGVDLGKSEEGPAPTYSQPVQQPAPYGQPQGGGYGQPNAYGQPGYIGYGVPDHRQATTVLILGILGLVLCSILAPFAWTMGNRVVGEIDASQGQIGGRSSANAGRICGIIGTALLALSLIAVLGVIVLAIVGASTATTSP